jgi:hypothetical protein
MSKLQILSTDTPEVVEAKTALIAARDEAITEAKSLIGKSVSPDSEEFKSAINGILEKSLEGLTVKQADKEVSIQKAFDAMQGQFDELAVKFNEGGSGIDQKNLSFQDAFAKALDAKADELSAASGVKKANKGKVEMSIEMKDMDFTDFGTGAYAMITTENRRGVYESPFSPIWLRNIFPNGSTTSGTIQYLRENSGTGAAGIWDGTASPPAAKQDVTFDFELESVVVDWIAATTRVPRQMLDDVAFLRTYVPNQLVYGRRGLLVAENTLIYDTLTDPANSVVYDGTKTNPVEIIYDAALGQMRDNYFATSAILMNNRDMVNLIALNKAAGSGEYDLPPGLSVVINGQLFIGGIPVIGLPQFPAGEFVAVDGRATQFISRMSPEVRVFEEDRDNVIKNLVTFRAEERAAFLVYDELAVITGSFGS